jgi:LuxR family transcriptional regulator
MGTEAGLNHTKIMHFMVAIREVPDSQTLTVELERLLASYGVAYYCVFSNPKPIENADQLIIAANWPASWVERYVAQKYIIVDPTIRYLLRANRSFAWHEAVDAYRDNPHYKRMKRMMADGKDNGLASGYIFPAFSRTGLVGATTIGGPKDIELSPVEIALLETAFREAYFRYLELRGEGQASAVALGLDISMTHREIQSLAFMAEGLTSGDIAQVLNVSSNTVDWYVNSLQAKLGARNRNQAVATGFRMGLIA